MTLKIPMTSYKKRPLTKIIIGQQIILMPLYQNNANYLLWNFLFFLKAVEFYQNVFPTSNAMTLFIFAIFKVKILFWEGICNTFIFLLNMSFVMVIKAIAAVTKV